MATGKTLDGKMYTGNQGATSGRGCGAAFRMEGLVLLCVAALACPLRAFEPPPPAPGEDAWHFREELALPENLAGYSECATDGPSGTPWISNRITRCFFGPIKRPPNNRDELSDSIDYYPDAYLARLRREGMNGVWITVEFRDLAETSFTKRRPDAPRKLDKLRRTVAKCAKYGIKVWLFAIEPHRLILPDDLYGRYRDALVAWEYPKECGAYGKQVLMCPSLPGTQRYLEESVCDIFTQVPGLGGLINISHGERDTTCLSLCPRVPADVAARGVDPAWCPHCGKIKPWQIHAKTLSAMERGLHSAAPDAKLISWLYHSASEPFRSDWVYELARHVPKGVVLQYNFESGIVKEQANAWRSGGDYWIAEPGPSPIFARLAESARAYGAELSAKIQTGSSHELATLPFVPVPGLLYRKYRGLRQLGVSNVMQCWYFGCYPGVMNEAAGLLSFIDPLSIDEKSFLLRLAEPKWGAEAPAVAALWQSFGEAYSDYPFSNVMQYYGPFHAGATWPLHADIAMEPLNSTWLPYQRAGGDVIAECLKRHHTLDEAVGLARKMHETAQTLTPEISRLRTKYAADRSRLLDINLMRALQLHFESAFDDLGFYLARREAVCLGRDRRDLSAARRALAEMRRFAERERAVSAELAELCAADSRLGFHPEAERHQYHPAILRWRIGTLDETLARLAAIDAELADGHPYPESQVERTKPVIAAQVDASGAYVFDFPVDGDAPLTLRFFDLCLTQWPKEYRATPKDGLCRFTIHPEEWNCDDRLRPTWVRVERRWLHGIDPIAPSLPTAGWRLRLNNVNAGNFARVVVGGGTGDKNERHDDEKN